MTWYASTKAYFSTCNMSNPNHQRYCGLCSTRDSSTVGPGGILKTAASLSLLGDARFDDAITMSILNRALGCLFLWPVESFEPSTLARPLELEPSLALPATTSTHIRDIEASFRVGAQVLFADRRHSASSWLPWLRDIAKASHNPRSTPQRPPELRRLA